jgi:iron complex outermembrane receptor protein
VLVILAWFGAVGAAEAEGPLMAFDISARPLKAALVQFAIQADISISTGAVAACLPGTRALQGRLTVAAGLTRLLAETGCTYRLIDTRTVEIVALPMTTAARPATKPADDPPLPTGDPNATVEELRVMVTRRPERAAELAYPVNTTSGETLISQGVHDANDLALTTPAMMVSNLGSGRDKIILRGLSDGPLTGHTQALVGIYLDGSRITFNAPDPDLRLVDMAHVEVLRGPQGALYGAGSLGGVLYLATAQPDASRRSAWLSATGGVTPGGAASSVLEGMVNTPLAAGRGAARFVAYREVDGGYIDDVGLGLSDVNRVVRAGFRLSGRFELNSRWTMSAGLTDQSINAADTQYGFTSEAPYTRNNQVREPHDNDFALANFALRGGFDWGDVRLTTGLIRHDINSRYDASSAPPVSVPPGPTAFDDGDDIKGIVNEATASSRDGPGIQWLVGAMAARTQQDIGFALTRLTPLPVVGFREARRDVLNEAALFGEAVIPLSSRVDLTVGGRAFVSHTSVSSLVQQAGATGPFTGKLSDAGIAPKLVLAFKPSTTLLFYAQASEGYRGGGFNTTGPVSQVFGANGAEPARQFRGDELWSFEAGGKAILLDGRLHFSITAYDERWHNVESDQLLPSGLPFTANIGNARDLGLEAEAVYESGGLRVAGSILLDAPELSSVNPSFAAAGDLNLALAPNILINGSARYRWTLAHSRTFELDGRLAYIGHSQLTFYSAQSPSMGDYITNRIAVALVSPHRRLSVAVDNIGDTRGNTFAYGNSFSFRSQPQVTPLRPRTLSVEFSVNY